VKKWRPVGFFQDLLGPTIQYTGPGCEMDEIDHSEKESLTAEEIEDREQYADKYQIDHVFGIPVCALSAIAEGPVSSDEDRMLIDLMNGCGRGRRFALCPTARGLVEEMWKRQALAVKHENLFVHACLAGEKLQIYDPRHNASWTLLPEEWWRETPLPPGAVCEMRYEPPETGQWLCNCRDKEGKK